MAFLSSVQVLFVVALSLVSLTTAFITPSRPISPALHSSPRLTRCSNGRCAAVRPLRMSENEVEEVVQESPAAPQAELTSDAAQQATQSVRSFFAPNENVRRGASKDQDGKSNVWAVEPKMRVEGKDVEKSDGNLLVVGGLVGVVVVAIVATIALLPSPDSL